MTQRAMIVGSPGGDLAIMVRDLRDDPAKFAAVFGMGALTPAQQDILRELERGDFDDILSRGPTFPNMPKAFEMGPEHKLLYSDDAKHFTSRPEARAYRYLKLAPHVRSTRRANAKAARKARHTTRKHKK